MAYPWDTPLRQVLVDIHVEVHRYVCATGIIASALLVILAFYIKEASFNGRGRDESPGTCSTTKDDVELQEGMRSTTRLRPSRHPILF